jgi:DNA-binding transcriptional ArsR family regulator
MFRVMDDRTWTALVDPHRRAVLDLLLQGECSVGDLVERLGLTQPQTSKHLRVLREAGWYGSSGWPSAGSTRSTRPR